MKKIMVLVILFLMLLGSYLIAEEVININALSIEVQDESLPNNLPDYPVEAQPPQTGNQPIYFDVESSVASPYMIMHAQAAETLPKK